jgi:hypothetical protein
MGRGVAMRHAGIALVVAAVLATGCGGTASGDRVALLTAGLSCYAGGEHPVTAELVADAEHGTIFSGQAVVWPTGFTGRRAGSEVEVLDAAGNGGATTGRRYWIARAFMSPYDSDRHPAAVDCGYPWDFGQCDASDEPTLPGGIKAIEHEESRAAYC